MSNLQENLEVLLTKAQAIRSTKRLRDEQLRQAILRMATSNQAAEYVGPAIRRTRWPSLRLRRERAAIARSGLFDWGYYYAAHPGLRESRMHPIDHYLAGHASAGANPNPLFDAQWYLERNPDVASSGINPLYHYVQFGARERRSPHPLFDTHMYLSMYADVGASGMNPLRHYLRHGGLEGRQAHYLFNAQAYLQEFPELHELRMTPLEHYCRYGAWLPFQPHPLFEPDHYLRQRQEVLVQGTNPLVHFLKSSPADMSDPSPHFRLAAYWQAHPDALRAGENPLLHFVSSVGPGHAAWSTDRPEFLLLAEAGESAPRLEVAPDAPRPLQKLQDFLYDEFGLQERVRIVAGMRHFRLPMDPERRVVDPRTDDLARLTGSVASIAASVPVAERPDVTIIVPVYNQLRFTLACLYSVFAHKTRYSFEIVVADDCSTDGTPDLLAEAGLPVRVVRPPQNLGFLRNCNHAARMARGRVLVFLNNDTYVLPGWLDELVGAVEDQPGVGLAGSKLVFSDGRLQESGGLVFADGSGWNYGRFDDARKPQYCFLRDSDYVSGASIAIAAPLWQELGGFDELYEKAYYEDTDLAFKVRAAGRRVVVQPLSQLIHFEGISSGTDITAGVKRYQVVNGERFRQRWAPALARHGTADSKNLPVHRGSKGTILVIDARTPMPDRDSGSMDTFQYLRILKSFGYHVLFAPENLVHAGHYSALLQRIGVQVLYTPFWPSMKAVLASLGSSVDYVLMYRAPVAGAVFDMVRRHAPKAMIIFDTVDLHFLRLEREAEIGGDAEHKRAAQRMKQAELDLIRKSDATIVLSRFERDLLRQLTPEARVFEIPIVREVPAPSSTRWNERRDIVFVGGFEHQPNVDAVKWFLAEVMPRLQSRGFAGDFVVVGSSMPGHIKALERPGVVMRGFVQDLEGFFSQVRLSVAPLRYGAGLKGKVISSLSYGVPVVATRVAVEGGGFIDGEHVLVGDEPDEMAEAIMRLYGDAELWARHSRAGRAFFIERFSVAAVAGKLQELLEGLAAPTRPRKSIEARV
jgi:GT2 family glycosyltransferase/glycosyltransferase involved in cell wall biosynthesis